MAPNFSDTLMEPTVLPAKFPNLLVNGTTGISAGYATNIPPHNLGEVCDAAIKRIESPNCRLETIMDIIKGPDFPTGGIVEGIDEIRKSFETGRGKIIVKCRYEFTKTKGKEQIVISEIPFEVNKQQLVKRIDDIRIDRKVEGMAEVRDESDKDAFCRIVIDLKPGADKNLIMNYLLKNTDCQCNYSYNMVTIVNRRPRLLGILGILDAWISHAKEVVKLRSEYDLAVAKKEVHYTEGLVKAISILDDVIRVIRASKNKQDAKDNLVKEFAFTPEQAEAIVMLQLYKLTNTDVVELQERLASLLKIIAGLEAILADETKLAGVVKDELRQIKKEYAVPRKTEIKENITEINISAEDLIVKESVMIILTKQGYIKKVPIKSYTSANGEETLVKPGDYCINMYETTTLNKLIIFTKLGYYIFVPVNDVPWCKWKELGKHVSNLVTLSPDDEVINCYVVNEDNADDTITIYTKDGMVKRNHLRDFFVSRYTKLYTSMKLKDGDYIVNITSDDKNALIVTKNGYYLSFDSNEIPYSSAKSGGVKGISLKDDEVVSGMNYNESDEYLDIFTSQRTAKRLRLTELIKLSRAKRGNMLIKKVKATNYEIVSALITNAKDMIGLVMMEDVEEIKNSDIAIMDMQSTGSAISKKGYEKAFKYGDIIKIEDAKNKTPKVKEEPQEDIDLNLFKI